MAPYVDIPREDSGPVEGYLLGGQEPWEPGVRGYELDGEVLDGYRP